MSTREINMGDARIWGSDARNIILNTYPLIRNLRRFRGSPLWSLVSDMTGHGIGYSIAICESAEIDPMQPCGPKHLKDFTPPHHEPA